MGEQTPTQKASQQMAEAVFADPELAERFKVMAKETAEREAVADDFAWLSSEVVARDKPSEWERFQSLTRRLLGVPKREIDKEREKRASGRSTRPK